MGAHHVSRLHQVARKTRSDAGGQAWTPVAARPHLGVILLDISTPWRWRADARTRLALNLQHVTPWLVDGLGGCNSVYPYLIPLCVNATKGGGLSVRTDPSAAHGWTSSCRDQAWLMADSSSSTVYLQAATTYRADVFSANRNIWLSEPHWTMNKRLPPAHFYAKRRRPGSAAATSLAPPASAATSPILHAHLASTPGWYAIPSAWHLVGIAVAFGRCLHINRRWHFQDCW